MNATKEKIDQEECFDTKLLLIQKPLINFAQSRVRNYSDAQDIVQKVLCILSEKRCDLKKNEGSFRSWAFKICEFQILGFIKKKSRRKTFTSENLNYIIDTNPIGRKVNSPIHEIISREITNERSKHLKKGIESLPQKQKDLMQCLFDGLDRSEILKKLDITFCSYYAMRRRAFSKIRSVNDLND
jgi:RNA polymerase sigma factor (sigma-70 family)